MKVCTTEWIEKAEADFHSAEREYRARNRPNYDATCFFAQQCIEKYLKARLLESGITFAKTHDLETLLDSLLPVEPLWEPFRPRLINLTVFAVSFRYPGETATKELAREALADVRYIRKQIRGYMGLAN
ncbi:MAG: HEPN domain-containing protein [Acidobacteriota bacterium]|jgi:HEPN domain-containing protein|nr:HEPN domain-containing protein [Acidobacteriota bacterium]